MSTLRDGAGRGDGLGERGGEVTGVDPADLDPDDSDAAVLLADDLLLDVLGRGGVAPPDDPLVGLMAAWRADLDASHSMPDVDLAVVGMTPAVGSVPATVTGQPSPGDGSDAATAVPGSTPARTRPPRPGAPVRRWRPVRLRPGPPQPMSGRRRRPGPLVRRLVLAAVVTVVATALLGLGVNQAGPTSPLWPIAAAVYPDRSTVRAVEHTITLARDAVQAGRYDDARHQLDRALIQVAEVRHPDLAGRLRGDIERIRLGLPAAGRDEVPPDGRTTPGSAPAASPTGRAPAPTRTPGGGASPPAGRPPASDPPPENPSPRQVLPLPVPVLPSLLPSGLPLLPSGGCLLLCPPD